MSQTRKRTATATITHYSNTHLLLAFLLAGAWAGSIVAFLLVKQDNDHYHANSYPLSVQLDEQDLRGTFLFPVQENKADQETFGRRNRQEQDAAPRTEEYSEDTAPDFQYPNPVGPDAPKAPDAPPVVEGPAPANEIEDIIGAVTNLFSGNGSFQDILKLLIAGFAIFGGAKFGASDGLLKVVLSIFSKKSNFTEIVNEHLKTTRPATRRAARKSRRAK